MFRPVQIPCAIDTQKSTRNTDWQGLHLANKELKEERRLNLARAQSRFMMLGTAVVVACAFAKAQEAQAQGVPYYAGKMRVLNTEAEVLSYSDMSFYAGQDYNTPGAVAVQPQPDSSITSNPNIVGVLPKSYAEKWWFQANPAFPAIRIADYAFSIFVNDSSSSYAAAQGSRGFWSVTATPDVTLAPDGTKRLTVKPIPDGPTGIANDHWYGPLTAYEVKWNFAQGEFWTTNGVAPVFTAWAGRLVPTNLWTFEPTKMASISTTPQDARSVAYGDDIQVVDPDRKINAVAKLQYQYLYQTPPPVNSLSISIRLGTEPGVKHVVVQIVQDDGPVEIQKGPTPMGPWTKVAEDLDGPVGGVLSVVEDSSDEAAYYRGARRL
jgi:hypothetical protein